MRLQRRLETSNGIRDVHNRLHQLHRTYCHRSKQLAEPTSPLSPLHLGQPITNTITPDVTLANLGRIMAIYTIHCAMGYLSGFQRLWQRSSGTTQGVTRMCGYETSTNQDGRAVLYGLLTISAATLAELCISQCIMIHQSSAMSLLHVCPIVLYTL